MKWLTVISETKYNEKNPTIDEIGRIIAYHIKLIIEGKVIAGSESYRSNKWMNEIFEMF